MHWIIDTVRHYLIAWGYWAVALGLIAEDAGLPLPGETILLFAAFLSYKNHELELLWIIIIGTVAAAVGDNIGYWVGRKGGRPLLEKHRRLLHLGKDTIKDGEELLKKHGDRTIFFARYIWGLRMLAGPLAGTLKMRWERFALWNLLGAVAWVTTIAVLGYIFGGHFDTLVGFFKKADIAIMAGVLGISIFLWVRYKRRKKKRKEKKQQEEDRKAA